MIVIHIISTLASASKSDARVIRSRLRNSSLRGAPLVDKGSRHREQGRIKAVLFAFQQQPGTAISYY